MFKKIFSKLRKRPEIAPAPVADDAPDGTICPGDPRYDVMMAMMRPGGPSIVIGNLDEDTGEWGVTGYDKNGDPMAVYHDGEKEENE